MIKDLARNLICRLFARYEHLMLSLTVEYLIAREGRRFQFRDLWNYPLARLVASMIGTRVGTQVIPLSLDLTAQVGCLSTREAMELVRQADSCTITECYCRKKYSHCDSPIANCIWFGKPLLLEQLNPVVRHNPSPEEVERILLEAEKAGLVHQTVFVPDLNTVYCLCNCCPCCCLSFRSPQVNYRPMRESPYLAAFRVTQCNGCGACVPRCYFDALVAREAGAVPRYYPKRCTGCGLCVSACPARALTLIPRQGPAGPVGRLRPASGPHAITHPAWEVSVDNHAYIEGEADLTTSSQARKEP